MLGNFALNFLIAGSLGQIWAIFNTLQIVVKLNLFYVKTPSNVTAFNNYFQDITSI